ncbi:hypothetical protein B9Z19DRAFT_941236, partial [Tuber borchii]
NFRPTSQPAPLEIHIQSYGIPHFLSMMTAMAKPADLIISSVPPDKPGIVFVPSGKQCQSSTLDILAYCVPGDYEDKFWNVNLEDISSHLNIIQENSLVESLLHGIGYYHEALILKSKRL